MARIRSIHPGLWTDERFMCVSPIARLLYIGLWGECDDKGSFEWSPLKLKARILPVDNIDVTGALDELAATGMIMSYEVGGRGYGAVRNFIRFQRPKKPNDLYPQTPAVRNYVGFNDEDSGSGSEQVGNQFPTAGEKSPQMEEGGGRREDGGDKEEVEGRARKSRSGQPHVFSGKIIKLIKSDFDSWKTTFHAIPDLKAELVSIDAWLADEPSRKKNWFMRVSGMLNRKHQELVALSNGNGKTMPQMPDFC